MISTQASSGIGTALALPGAGRCRHRVDGEERGWGAADTAVQALHPHGARAGSCGAARLQQRARDRRALSRLEFALRALDRIRHVGQEPRRLESERDAEHEVIRHVCEPLGQQLHTDAKAQEAEQHDGEAELEAQTRDEVVGATQQEAQQHLEHSPAFEADDAHRALDGHTEDEAATDVRVLEPLDAQRRTRLELEELADLEIELATHPRIRLVQPPEGDQPRLVADRDGAADLELQLLREVIDDLVERDVELDAEHEHVAPEVVLEHAERERLLRSEHPELDDDDQSRCVGRVESKAECLELEALTRSPVIDKLTPNPNAQASIVGFHASSPRVSGSPVGRARFSHE